MLTKIFRNITISISAKYLKEPFLPSISIADANNEENNSMRLLGSSFSTDIN